MTPEFANLTELERRVLLMVEARPSPGRNAARSAIHHIERARKIQSLDPEMALFRALTGEEEASRAVIHALHRLRYPGSDRLKWKVHRHKAAMVPFLAAVGALIAKGPLKPPQVQILTKNGIDQPALRFEVTLPSGEVVGILPNPPLQLQVSIDGKPHDFAIELDELLAETSLESIDKWILQRAEERNWVLYATEAGIPAIGGDIGQEIETRRGNIFACITAFLLIDTFQVHQRFVVQCLPTYLGMLALLTKEAEPEGVNSR
jgi:hypothetical protein